jgi:SHS2 domain-containing protein
MRNNNSTWKLIEIEHTADAAIMVSADDLKSLFLAAATGMYSIAGAQYDASGRKLKKELNISEIDSETLLVSFLNELLFLLENGIFFNEFNLEFQAGELKGTLRGFPVISIEREIKAVTFNNLQIKKTNEIFSTQIVFDI